MKILIVGLAKIKYMPYLNFYLDSINKEKNEIHVVYWNRDGKEEDLSKYSNIFFHEFCFKQFNSVNKFLKIKPYIRYRKFVNSLCKSNQFDFIIVLHSLSALVVSKYMKSQKYILDYRDTSLEKYLLFRKLLKKWVINSYATFVSSEGFLKYLPKTPNVHISHNLLLDSLNYRNYEKKSSNKIRISFWGYIRNVKINLLLINSISKDERFELHYYGREQADALELKKYCVDNGLKNIYFHGEYSPEDRYSFVKETDIIHNLYFDENMKIAMGNKYYDGIIFKIPQLCYKNSLMGSKVMNKCIGVSIDQNDENISEIIYNYYINLQRDKFEKNCDEELNRILEEYNYGKELINKIC